MAENEAVFPIRYPTDTSGISKGVTELERLRAALQEDQKQIAGLQKAMASLKLDPDVQAYIKMQSELKKASADAEKATEKLKELKAARVAASADPKKVEKLDSQIAAEQAKVDKANAAVERHKKGLATLDTKPAVQQYKYLDKALKDSEASLAENQSKYLAAGGDMTKMGDKVKSGFDKFSEGADMAGGSLGGLKSKFEALKALGPAGIVAAIVITVVALGVALAKATFDLTRFAIEAGDAARSMGILMEAAAGSAKGGKELGGMARRLRNDFAGSREEIAGMVLELRRSGLEGVHLEKTVRLAGIATKTMGEAAGGILKGLIDRGHLSKRFVLNPFDLRGTGLAYDDVAKQLSKLTGRTIGTVKAALINGQVKLTDGIAALEGAVKDKFGDLAKRQLLALPEQVNRARENLRAMFSGVNVDKFLVGLAKVLDLLDESTTSGRMLRAVAKDIFQPIIDFAGSSVLPMIRTFFIGLSISILDVTIVALKAYIWFKKTFGDTSLFKGIDGAKVAFYAGRVAVVALIGGIAALMAIFTALGGLVAFATAPIWALPAAVSAAIASVVALKNKIASVMGGGTEGAKDAGNDTAKGIADGIKDGAPAVNAAMTDLAKGGKEAFENELKIASPSKEMRATAKWIGPGVAQGVDDGQPIVERAMSRLVDPQDAVPVRRNGQQATAASGEIHVHVGQIVIGGDGKISAPSRASLITELVEVAEDVRRQLAMRPAQ
jgi:hypothetical protein